MNDINDLLCDILLLFHSGPSVWEGMSALSWLRVQVKETTVEKWFSSVIRRIKLEWDVETSRWASSCLLMDYQERIGCMLLVHHFISVAGLSTDEQITWGICKGQALLKGPVFKICNCWLVSLYKCCFRMWLRDRVVFLFSFWLAMRGDEEASYIFTI
jgi:hypothetical protein